MKKRAGGGVSPVAGDSPLWSAGTSRAVLPPVGRDVKLQSDRADGSLRTCL